MQLKVWSLRITALVLLFGSWSYATGPGGVSPLLLPKIDLVWDQLLLVFQTGDLWSDVAVTLGEIGAAFAISVVAGVLVGFGCSRTELRARVAEPLIAWGYMVPMVLFYPLFVLWLDVGPWSKIAYAALAGFFPVAFNSLRGFRSVDPRYLNVARAFGASSTQTDRLVKVQAALPMVLSGVRVGAALNMISVVLAEMLASSRGLGYELARSSQTLQIPRVFALIVVLLIFVAIMQLAIQRLGRSPHHS